jgi:DNA adenine methylase
MKPVIKWAGGKSSSMKVIADYIYINPDILYVEPFIGGGSVLLTFKPFNAIINDVNPNLMCMYHVVKYFPAELCCSLTKIDHVDEQIYQRHRALYNSIKFNETTDFYSIETSRLVNIATLFIFLNKAGFNGLYRENNKGEFNVPYGKHKSVDYDADNIVEISRYFNDNNIRMSCISYDAVLQQLNTTVSTTIYLDPPYYECKESKFTSYSGLHAFGKNDHATMYKLVNSLSLKSKGKWHIVCSNSYDEYTIKQPKLTHRLVEFSRSMDKKSVKEIISYTPTSNLWKDLDKYLTGKSKFDSSDIERQFIKLYSSGVLLNSANRCDTFNIGKLGEMHAKRIFAEQGIELQKCPFKESVRPDGFIEIGNEKLVVEIKSRTYTCVGTASEKIDCIPRKLSLIYKKYGYKSIVIFVAGQIIEKSGNAFLTENSDYVKSFKEFAEREAGIIAWLSIKDIPMLVSSLLKQSPQPQ